MPKNTSLDVSENDGDIERHIIFVTGMHRSATSAFSGSLALLGAALPKHMLGAAVSNPKGHFESENVVQANDRVLAGMQRHWNDCRPINQPEGEDRKAAEDQFAQLIQTEFGTGPIVALKDPRVSLLSPAWVAAAQRTDAQTSFVVMLRDPVAVASSIIKRDGMEAEAAIALWLRYMFDAERNSRGQRRIILSAEAFVQDPVATLQRVGKELDLSWPTNPETARAELTEFIDTSLLAAWVDMDTPLADFASEVHAALLDLAEDRGDDDAEGLARIDMLSAEFDANCPAIHDRMVYDQLEKAVVQKWRSDATQAALQKTKATVAELQVEAEALENQAERLKAQAAAEREAALAQASTAAAEREAALAQASTAAAEREAALAQASTAAAEREAALAQAATAAAEREAALVELTRARRRPLKLVRDKLKFKLLRSLSKRSPPVPKRVAERFARSAAKRDPNRSLEAKGQHTARQ